MVISSSLFAVNFGAKNAFNGTAFFVKKWSGNNRSCFQTTNKIINSSAYAQSEAESIPIVLKAKNQLSFHLLEHLEQEKVQQHLV